MNKTYRNLVLVAIFVISASMHFSHFSKDLMGLHVWRQTQTQSTINNFYEEDMNILAPRRNDRGDSEGVFRMEFPLMQWLIACVYNVTGKHILITRLFMFLIGFLSISGMYRLLGALFDKPMVSVFGAWAFTFSPSFYYYTINPLPDNFALCCSIWGLTFFFFWYKNKQASQLIISSLLLSVGALCKLPFIIYYIVPIVYFAILIAKAGMDKKIISQLFQAFGFSILPIAWYLAVIPDWEGNLIVKGVLNKDSSGLQILTYAFQNLSSTLPELLLNYGSVLFFLSGIYLAFKKSFFRKQKFILLASLGLLTILYYFFEANAIGINHDYYFFPFFPLLFILVGYGACQLYAAKNSLYRYLTICLLLILPITCYLRMCDAWNPDAPKFNSDLLRYKTELRNAVPKDALVVAGNDVSHFIFLYYIDKKGWGFQDDRLNSDMLQSMIVNGAQYLYSDAPSVYTNPEIANLLDKLVLEKGSIRIYSLKTAPSE